MKNSSEIGKSAEDYLESMIILKEKNGYVRSVDIAGFLGVTKPSVSNAMKRLREEGYIEMNRSGFITVTDNCPGAVCCNAFNANCTPIE